MKNENIYFVQVTEIGTYGGAVQLNENLSASRAKWVFERCCKRYSDSKYLVKTNAPVDMK